MPGGAALGADAGHLPAEFALLDDPMEWPTFGKPFGQSSAAAAVTVQDPASVPVWDSQVALGGMYCATCALTIEDALRAVPGVQRVEVSAAAQRARVVWRAGEVKPSQWIQAVRRAGYQAVPAQDARARELRQAHSRKALWRWLLATFCMMQVMMYAWPAYEAAPGDLSMEMETLLRWASWVICIPMLIFSCGPFFSGALRDLRHGRVSMDLPVALGMVLTFVISTLGTFDPTGIFGREVFYDSLVMFVAFLLTGRWLEIRLRDRTAGALDAVLNRLPDSVEQRQLDGSFARVALRKIAVADVVRVLPGESFPADGRIVRGRTQADEALLTGESRPISKEEGSAVIAGSFNLSAAVEVQVERLGSHTRFAEIVALMESASTQKPRLAQLADRVAGPFLVSVLVLAALAAAYWWSTDPGHALMVAATVLIVTCPCALSLATPVAMLTAAGTLARHGVLVRNLQALESLASMDTLVFDKTGTLTDAAITVSARTAVDGTEAALPWQALAAAVAAHSMHPVSRAVAAMSGLPGQALWQVLQVEEVSGQGLRAEVFPIAAEAEQALAAVCDGVTPGEPVWVRLGSRQFVAAVSADGLNGNGHAMGTTGLSGQAVCLGLEVGAGAGDAPFLATALSPVSAHVGDSSVASVPNMAAEGVVSAGHAPAGSAAGAIALLAVFALHEGVRPEAGAVIDWLRRRGMRVHLLSGDSAAAVARVAEATGIGADAARAQCSPQDKLGAMRGWQAQGQRVGMVGDGLNDGPVLAGADVSFAFGRAVPLAQAQSDFVVPGDDLGLIVRTVEFARQTLRIVRQNLWWAAAYNAVSVPFAVAGMMPAWLAGLGMALSSLLVVLNAARLTRFAPGLRPDCVITALPATAVAVRHQGL